MSDSRALRAQKKPVSTPRDPARAPTPAVEVVWRRPQGRRPARPAFQAQTYDDSVQPP